LLAASGYFEDTKDAAQAVVKVLAGAELGFGPIASMTGVYIVKGRVTMSANLMAAAIKRWRPRYNFKLTDLTNERAVIAFFEDGEEQGTSEFTMDDARAAGLANGENWKKYPRNMLFARAMSNGAKFYCPDVFAGAPVYTPDELGAEIDPESGELRRDAMPTPAFDPSTGEVIDATQPTPVSAGNPASSAQPSSAREESPATSEGEPASPAVPVADADDPVSAEEAAKLTELLDTLSAPESFRRMALMTYGAEDLAGLSRQQAAEVADKAVARFGG
jgi:hypothetical protein